MNKGLSIVAKRKIFFCISIALILIGIVCNIFLGVQLDISFKGGTLLKYSFTGDIDEPKLDAFITNTLKKEVDTTLSTDGSVNIINVSLVEELSLDETKALTSALTKEYPKSELKLSTPTPWIPPWAPCSLSSAWWPSRWPASSC